MKKQAILQMHKSWYFASEWTRNDCRYSSVRANGIGYAWTWRSLSICKSLCLFYC